MSAGHHNCVTSGAALVVAYTIVITVADAFTKHLATSFAAPQVLVICSGCVALVAFARASRRRDAMPLRVASPGAMVVRSLATVLASVGFYYAFALLPFAEVFLFIALMPIMSGLMSAPILGEPVRPITWAALACGSLGVYLLFPAGLHTAQPGHAVALAACVFGTLAIVMARYMGRVEAKPLAQVFYPQVTVFLVMAAVAPFVWRPMAPEAIAMAVLCGAALFIARYLLAMSLQTLPAYAVTPLVNLQFVWMVAVGSIVFGEAVAPNMLLGAAVIIASSVALIYQQRNDNRVHVAGATQPAKDDPRRALVRKVA